MTLTSVTHVPGLRCYPCSRLLTTTLLAVALLAAHEEAGKAGDLAAA